jgi:hypothetical protein
MNRGSPALIASRLLVNINNFNENTDIKFIFSMSLFFYNQLYWDKNNKHNAFQHIPTEIDEVSCKFQNRPCYLRFLMREKMGG